MNKANGVMNNIRAHMSGRNIKSMQDNKVREMHHHTIQNLKGVEQVRKHFVKDLGR